MDYEAFYSELFRPIEERIGRVDEKGIIALMGFDGGGPVNLSTVGYGRERFVTYITCELSVRENQKPAAFGSYELMITCDDESWASDILTRLGQMSFEASLDHGHTVDIGPVVAKDFPLQGLVLERFSQVVIEGRSYGILRTHGVTRPELNFARERGADVLLKQLEQGGVYPRTSTHRTQSFTPTG